MERIEKLGSAKRFGARYGSKPKHKFAKIEKEQRKKHKCPYCSAIKVKRITVGVWYCKRCNAKFTGKAYSVSKAITFEKEGTEEKEAMVEEAMEDDDAIEQNDIEQKEAA